MPVTIPDLRLHGRSHTWKWWVCGLLLLATMVNYMDRLTLNLQAKDIMADFGLGPRQYGYLESAFGVAFALGAVLMGWLADRWNVRGIYAAAVLLWSAAGFVTGLAHTFAALLVCRFLLGLAEAGNWPCALRTTQHILPPSERTMGNSILQSGAAVGAVLTPMIVLGLFEWTGTWRYTFMAVGGLGVVWVVLWMTSVRQRDLARKEAHAELSLLVILGWLVFWYVVDLGIHVRFADAPLIPLAGKFVVTALGVGGVACWLAWVTRDETASDRPARAVFFRRFAVLAVLVVVINITWHFFRAWLPLFLQNQHGYTRAEFSWFSMAYYVATDAGSLAAGFATLRLARGGLPVHTSRLVVFAACALMTTLSVVAAVLPAGPLLLGVLLVVGFAALGVFPNYYSFSQELTVRHQGKVTGALGCICWMSMSLLHEVVGGVVEQTGSYSQGVACAGLLPLVGVAILFLFWGEAPARVEDVAEEDGAARPHAADVRVVVEPPALGPQAIQPAADSIRH
jgi:ACS family hexuronate transporter-like MFS transporter